MELAPTTSGGRPCISASVPTVDYTERKMRETYEIVHDISHVVGYPDIGRVVRKDLVDRDFGGDEEFRLWDRRAWPYSKVGKKGMAYLGLVASVDKGDEPPCLACPKKKKYRTRIHTSMKHVQRPF